MFDIDSWREIFQSIQKNKLRAILSGFTVAFAILLFTLLFGIVSGLQNYFKSQFISKANNSISIRASKTSKPYKGLQAGRVIQFKNKHLNFISDKFKKQIQYLSAVKTFSAKVTNRNKQDTYTIRAIHPDYQYLEKIDTNRGRFINNLDLTKNNKVAVLGRLTKLDLFGEHKALGKYVDVNGVVYRVIGVFSSDGGDNQERIIYMPISTAQKVYGNNDFIDQIIVGYDVFLSVSKAIKLGESLEKKLKNMLTIHPKDEALYIRNAAEANKGITQITMALLFVVFFVGFGTLIAGIIGISNIMIFSIKERTKELGIRKALGAKPSTIVGMVVKESLIITTLSGYLGLFLGTFILKQIGNSLEKYFIQAPSIGDGLVIAATVTLILAGLLAGYLPAKRASRIKPIVALRAD